MAMSCSKDERVTSAPLCDVMKTQVEYVDHTADRPADNSHKYTSYNVHVSNSQVCALHLFLAIYRKVSRNFIALCMVLVYQHGTPIWRLEINTNICISGL